MLNALRPLQAAGHAHLRAGAAILLLAGLACFAGAIGDAAADTITVKSAELRPAEDAYILNAEFDVSINSTLEEALQKGIPLYFVLEFEISKPRWYWFDQKVLSRTTQYRVSFSALLRQYRVQSGLLSLNFDSIDEIERFLSRVTSRPVARIDELDRGARYEVGVRLFLDVNQLPKPFQFNAIASREWTLASDWHRWSYAP